MFIIYTEFFCPFDVAIYLANAYNYMKKRGFKRSADDSGYSSLRLSVLTVCNYYNRSVKLFDDMS